MASALMASHRFVAIAAERVLSNRYPVKSRSTRVTPRREMTRKASSAAATAVRWSASSFGMKKRSSSNALNVDTTSTTAIAPICMIRRARRSARLGCSPGFGSTASILVPAFRLHAVMLA